jgi:hypothetical protein
MRRSVVGRMPRTAALPAALAAAMVLLVGACATSRPSDAGGGASELITADEIATSHATNAYEAIAKLRHNFLSNRGKTSLLDTSAPSLPNVYLDGVPYGPLSSLSNIPAGDVLSIRLYRAWEASTKYGTGNPAGVIEVTTKRQ